MLSLCPLKKKEKLALFLRIRLLTIFLINKNLAAVNPEGNQVSQPSIDTYRLSLKYDPSSGRLEKKPNVT